jgi:hypothetical protein
MTSRTHNIFIFLTLTAVLQYCTPSATLYSKDDKGKYVKGVLPDSSFRLLKQFLDNNFAASTDTIIIKYDYNYETCWDRLDEKDGAFIQSIIDYRNKLRDSIALSRPHTIFLTFREPGKQLNRIKINDTAIVIDSTKFLLNNFFAERCTCGQSLIVFPNKQFIRLRSDPHNDAFFLKSEFMEVLLGMKL